MTPNAHGAPATDPYTSPLVSGGTRRYDVVAVRVPIVFNFDGDHDHNGMIYAMARHKDALDDIRRHFAAHAKTPHPLVRPLVLRARCGETVEVRFTNHIQGRCVGMHLVGDGYDVRTSDGAAVGANPSSLAAPGQTLTYTWHCRHEGVFPFHDMGDLSGGQDGTNVHGLFGALVVEPPKAEWTDPVTGQRLDVPDDRGYTQGDGLYVDVHPEGLAAAKRRPKYPRDKAPGQPMDPNASFREYAIFFHDEPEFAPPHERPEPPSARLRRAAGTAAMPRTSRPRSCRSATVPRR
jgi:hypothetical protein